MAPKKSFRKAYVGIVMDMALARSKISNRMVAQRLGVDETTIRRWRKENIEFERAFTEALEALREKINRVAGKSLDVRKRKVVTTSPDGVKTTILLFSQRCSVLVPASIARKNVSVMCFAR